VHDFCVIFVEGVFRVLALTPVQISASWGGSLILFWEYLNV